MSTQLCLCCIAGIIEHPHRVVYEETIPVELQKSQYIKVRVHAFEQQ